MPEMDKPSLENRARQKNPGNTPEEGGSARESSSAIHAGHPHHLVLELRRKGALLSLVS